MHIPSERIYKEIKGTAGSIWYVPASGGGDTAILIKAPSNTLKAVTQGCKIELLFGKYIEPQQTYLCIGIRIHDTLDTPLLLFSLQHHDEEHDALLSILISGSSPVFLFSEMDMCVAWSDVVINENDAKRINQFINDKKHLYTGDFLSSHNSILDSFQVSLDPTCEIPETKVIPSISLAISCEKWVSTSNHFIGYHEQSENILDSSDEGENFESNIWFALDSVFHLDLHKNLKVLIGNKKRELTDIIAFYKLGTFLIEAKNLSVIEAGFNRTEDRKIRGIIKQIKKAVGQLKGAHKAILRGDPVYDLNGDIVPVDKKVIPHCIILVSEIVHAGDWSEAEDALREGFMETGAFYHVLDLREFITLLKISSGKKELLDYNLMERFKLFIEKGSLHIRGEPKNNKK